MSKRGSKAQEDADVLSSIRAQMREVEEHLKMLHREAEEKAWAYWSPRCQIIDSILRKRLNTREVAFTQLVYSTSPNSLILALIAPRSVRWDRDRTDFVAYGGAPLPYRFYCTPEHLLIRWTHRLVTTVDPFLKAERPYTELKGEIGRLTDDFKREAMRFHSGEQPFND